MPHPIFFSLAPDKNIEMQEVFKFPPLFTNDATVLAVLLGLLAIIFVTASSSKSHYKAFYKYIPMLLLCYFLPSIFNSLGIIAPEWIDVDSLTSFLKDKGLIVPEGMSRKEWLAFLNTNSIGIDEVSQFKQKSSLYFVASRYMLPASLVLLTLSIDLKAIINLGPKAIIMFLAGTVGIVIGGPLAILTISYINPDLVGGSGPDAVWRGLSTVAGSWIGGGANQTAMKEVFGASDKLFSAMITVDVIVANIWMAFLLYGAGKSKLIDKKLKADSTAIDALKHKMEDFQKQNSKTPTLTDLMVIVGIGLGVTGFAHLVADIVAPWMQENAPHLSKFSLTSGFFWIIVVATTGGLALSFTKLRKYEGVGASRVGSAFLYVLVATIGMKMDITAIFENLGLFFIGIVWMLIHVIVLLGVAKLIKAPFFFVAVGSQANVGGAASAPVVASAFHPALAPVGVLLAVLGYALGTYAAWFCTILMQMAS
ncbi:MAG: putative membrane protein [Flavobacteriales bacterium]